MDRALSRVLRYGVDTKVRFILLSEFAELGQSLKRLQRNFSSLLINATQFTTGT